MQTKNQTFGDSMKAFILALFIFLSIDMAFPQPVPSEAQYQLNQNKLLNPGFEQGRRGWTSAAGTLTATAANGVDDGVNAGCVTLSSQTLNVSQVIPVGNLRGQGEVSVEAYATVAGAQVCSVVDNVDVNCVPVANLSAWRNRVEIGFVAGATNYGIRYKSLAPVTGTFCLDSAYAGKMPTGRISEVGAIGPWVDYGAITVGANTTAPTKGTVVRDRLLARQVGNNLELNFEYQQTSTGGASGTGGYLLSIPPGFTIDTSRFPANTSLSSDTLADDRNKVGEIAIQQNAGMTTSGGVFIFDSTRLYVKLYVAADSGSTSASLLTGNLWGSGSSPITFGATNLGFRVNASVPIANLSNKTTVYSQQCNRDVDCESIFSAKVATDGTVSGETLDWLNGNCTNSTSMVCNFNPNIFTVAPNCWSESNGGGNLYVNMGGYATSSSVQFQKQDLASVPFNHATTIFCQKTGVDSRPRLTINGTFEDVVTSPGSSRSSLCSAKVSSSGVLSDQIGGCFASCTNATTPVCTYTTNYWVSGSVPNCWVSAFGAFPGSVSINTSTQIAINLLNDVGGAASGNRKYFCIGLR